MSGPFGQKNLFGSYPCHYLVNGIGTGFPSSISIAITSDIKQKLFKNDLTQGIKSFQSHQFINLLQKADTLK